MDSGSRDSLRLVNFMVFTPDMFRCGFMSSLATLVFVGPCEQN